MTTTCVLIEFHLCCSAQQYEAIVEEAAPRVNEVPGLVSKLWWLDREALRAGGVYVFGDRAAAQQYVDGALVATLRDSSFCKNVQTRVMDLLDVSPHQSEPESVADAVPSTTPGSAPSSDEESPSDTERFVHQVLGDLSSTMTGVMLSLGHRLGFYEALAVHGPLTSVQLAERTHVAERYAREWLHQQRAAGYLSYDAPTCRFALTSGAAPVLAVADSPVFLPPAFEIAASVWADERRLAEAFRSGAGIGWGEHDGRLFCGCARFFGSAYTANLTDSWLPALQGVAEKLERGARVADVGCGHGVSTALMARAFPASTFVGVDIHAESIDHARRNIEELGLSDRVAFNCASATDYDGPNYDLICFMDSFHDMGDAVEAARYAAQRLAPGGCVMLVEPTAAERAEDNQGPLAALNYAASTALCTPSALCHRGGIALGAQAGPRALREALAQGGLTRFRVAAQTPFHMVIEAR